MKIGGPLIRCTLSLENVGVVDSFFSSLWRDLHSQFTEPVGSSEKKMRIVRHYGTNITKILPVSHWTG